MIPQQFIDDLLRRVDVVEVVGQYVQLKRAGANYSGLCPFHIILDYSSTTKNKTVRWLGGCDLNGSGEIYFGSGLWYISSIAAITSITLKTFDGNANFTQYSSFALYGIKGA